LSDPEVKGSLPAILNISQVSRSEDPPIHFYTRIPRWAHRIGSLNNFRYISAKHKTTRRHQYRQCKADYYINTVTTSVNRIPLLPHLTPDLASSRIQPQINSVALSLHFTLWSENPKILGELPRNVISRTEEFDKSQPYCRAASGLPEPVFRGYRSPRATPRERE
jgi:hypothetical protein